MSKNETLDPDEINSVMKRRAFDSEETDLLIGKASRSNALLVTKSESYEQENVIETTKSEGEKSSYISSSFSVRHLTAEACKERSSTICHTLANSLNMLIGIGIITFPLSVKRAGFGGAIFGFFFVVFLNLLSVYFLLKARNRFKKENINSLGDLAYCCYGEKGR
jgi:hypothetical protein